YLICQNHGSFLLCPCNNVPVYVLAILYTNARFPGRKRAWQSVNRRLRAAGTGSPPTGGGVQLAGGGVEQGVADGGGHAAASLAAHGRDGRDAEALADLHQTLLALHHVDEAHRHPDDQGGAEISPLHGVAEGKEGGGGVAHRKDRPWVDRSGMAHGGHRPGGAGRFRSEERR